MKKQVVLRSFGTHDGSFHADEVTACALLLLFDCIDRVKVFRTRDQARLDSCEYICDVGGKYNPRRKLFDHHQSNYRGSLSSAGMVLKYLNGKKVFDERTYHYLNRSLIKGVDAIDNGKLTPQIGHCTFSAVIANFVPAQHDLIPSQLDKAFFEAVDFTLGHLRRLLEKLDFIQSYQEVIKQEMDKNGTVLIFEESIPWLDMFFEMGGEHHPGQFIIMPTGNSWKLRGIPPSYKKRMDVRHPLPQDWAGLSDKALKRKTGIEGAIFCHKGRFISVWKTKEDALKAFNLIMPEGS